MNKTGEDQGCDVYPHPEKQIKMHNKNYQKKHLNHFFICLP